MLKNVISTKIISALLLTTLASSFSFAQFRGNPSQGEGDRGFRDCPRENPNCRDGGFRGGGDGGFRNPPRGPGHGGGGGFNPNPGPQSIFVTARLYRNVTNENLDLRRYLPLDRYQGYRLVSIKASTTPNSPGKTVAQILSNGQVLASQTNPGYLIYLTPNYRIQLDRFNQVVLAIFGSTYISEIQVELRR